jgi:hypothetical protein
VLYGDPIQPDTPVSPPRDPVGFVSYKLSCTCITRGECEEHCLFRVFSYLVSLCSRWTMTIYIHTSTLRYGLFLISTLLPFFPSHPWKVSASREHRLDSESDSFNRVQWNFFSQRGTHNATHEVRTFAFLLFSFQFGLPRNPCRR